MRADKYKIAKVVITLIVVIALGAGIIQTFHQSANDKERAASQEFVGCISAICIDRAPGQQCLELTSIVATVIVTDDSNVIGAKRIVVETGSKQCGTPIFK